MLCREGWVHTHSPVERIGGGMAKAKTRGVTVRGRSAKRSREEKATAAMDVGSWEAPVFKGEFPDESLSWEDRQLLGTVIRYLFTVVEPPFLRRALRAAYTKEEHDELWRLFDRAAGRAKSLDLLEPDLDGGPERQRVLLEVDGFENTWFPRADRIIRRLVPEDHVEHFLATFFKDLAQQPLGPGVLDSTSTF